MKTVIVTLGMVVIVVIVFLLIRTLAAINYCDNQIKINYRNLENRIIVLGNDEIRINYIFSDKIITLAYKYTDVYGLYIPGVNSKEREGPFYRISSLDGK